jgi:hypothetical protein
MSFMLYNVFTGGAFMSTISLRLDERDRELIKRYAAINNISSRL